DPRDDVAGTTGRKWHDDGYRFGRIIVRSPGAARGGQENRGKQTDGGPRRDAAYLRLTDAFPNARKDSTHPSLLPLPEAVSAPALSSTSCSRTPNGSPYTIKIGVGRKAFHVVSRQGGRSSLAHGQTSPLAGERRKVAWFHAWPLTACPTIARLTVQKV